VAGSSSTVAQRYLTFGEWCPVEPYMDDGGLGGIQRSVNGLQQRCFRQGYRSESGETAVDWSEVVEPRRRSMEKKAVVVGEVDGVAS
jgi:hypothetical protein